MRAAARNNEVAAREAIFRPYSMLREDIIRRAPVIEEAVFSNNALSVKAFHRTQLPEYRISLGCQLLGFGDTLGNYARTAFITFAILCHGIYGLSLPPADSRAITLRDTALELRRLLSA